MVEAPLLLADGSWSQGVSGCVSCVKVVEAPLFLADGSWSPGHEVPALAGLGEGHHVTDRVGPEMRY